MRQVVSICICAPLMSVMKTSGAAGDIEKRLQHRSKANEGNRSFSVFCTLTARKQTDNGAKKCLMATRKAECFQVTANADRGG